MEYNTIKVINFEWLSDNLSEDLDHILISIENDKSLIGVYFFYMDNKEHNLFFQHMNEAEVVHYLTGKLGECNRSVIKDCINDYGQILFECYGESDEEISFGNIGRGITITNKQVYASLADEFLNNQFFIDRLVNSKDFNKELEMIKLEVMGYLFDLTIEDAKIGFRNYVQKTKTNM